MLARNEGTAIAAGATLGSEMVAMLRRVLLVAAFICVFAFVSIFLAEGLHAAGTVVSLP